jgi:hypothetical protein
VTFATQVIADLSTFLNVDEFGESVDLDGQPVTCVFDGNGDTESSHEGVTDVDTIAYVRMTDIEARPVVGQRLTLGDDQADVVGVDEQNGLYVLRLRWYDS